MVALPRGSVLSQKVWEVRKGFSLKQGGPGLVPVRILGSGFRRGARPDTANRPQTALGGGGAGKDGAHTHRTAAQD